ncbi:MAG: tetratricopeptide repeat protein [Pirellulaceae bacterium]
MGNQALTSEQLYSPAMLAELLQVSVRVIRRWYRAGLLQPTQVVMQVPYFCFSQVATAKQLARWMRSGIKVQSIENQLRLIRSRVGEHVALDTMRIVAHGKRLVLLDGDSVMEATGQFQFGFEADDHDTDRLPTTLRFEPASTKAAIPGAVQSLEQMINEAMEAEDVDDLDMAIDWYRAALTAYGPNPDICFQLAELLYRQGDVSGARERYFMAIELDPGLVEAQANLGCVLAESGQLELAIAAFEGALQQFSDYADVHFHLARALDDAGQTDRAVDHWLRFLELAPVSPWAEEARERLGQTNATWLDF